MLKRTVKISQCLLLHASFQLDHPQGAYAEPCQSYNIVELISKNTSLYDMQRCATSISVIRKQVHFFIVVPCILISSRFFSPTNAPFY
jgi:hypothetical protein